MSQNPARPCLLVRMLFALFRFLEENGPSGNLDSGQNGAKKPTECRTAELRDPRQRHCRPRGSPRVQASASEGET